jgi:hypothetical protein
MADSKRITTSKNVNNIGIGDVEDIVVVQNGGTQDDLELMELTGHEQVLERNYSTFGLLAMSFMIVDPFMGIMGSLAAGISSGGTVSFLKNLNAGLYYSPIFSINRS